MCLQKNPGTYNPFIKLLLFVGKKHDQLGKILKGFEGIYARELLSIHRQKLGLKNAEEGDQKLVDEWISCMKIAEADLTMSWRQLSEISDQDLFEVTTLHIFASVIFKCPLSIW